MTAVRRGSTGSTISIVMAAHNAAPHIARAIESVLAQDHADWELLVIDDGSEDGTADVVARYAGPGIRLIRLAENRGRGAARNAGLGQTTGGFVTFLDADDTYFPNKLSAQLTYLHDHPDCDAVACGFQRIAQGRVVRVRRLPERRIGAHEFLYGVPAFLQSTLFRARALEGARFVTGVYGEDWDFVLRLALGGMNFAAQSAVLWDYHDGESARAKTDMRYCRDQVAVLTRNRDLIVGNLPAGEHLYEAALARAVVKVSARSIATGKYENLPAVRSTFAQILSPVPSWAAIQEGRDIAHWRTHFGTMCLKGIVSDVLAGRFATQRGKASLALVAEYVGYLVASHRFLRVGSYPLQMGADALAALLNAYGRGLPRAPLWWQVHLLYQDLLIAASRRRLGGEAMRRSLGWEAVFGADRAGALAALLRADRRNAPAEAPAASMPAVVASRKEAG